MDSKVCFPDTERTTKPETDLYRRLQDVSLPPVMGDSLEFRFLHKMFSSGDLRENGTKAFREVEQKQAELLHHEGDIKRKRKSNSPPLPLPETVSTMLDNHRIDWLSPSEFCLLQPFSWPDEKVDVKPFLVGTPDSEHLKPIEVQRSPADSLGVAGRLDKSVVRVCSCLIASDFAFSNEVYQEAILRDETDTFFYSLNILKDELVMSVIDSLEGYRRTEWAKEMLLKYPRDCCRTVLCDGI